MVREEKKSGIRARLVCGCPARWSHVFEGRDMSSCKVAANKVMISKAAVLSMVRCLQLAMGVATQLAAVLFCFLLFSVANHSPA